MSLPARSQHCGLNVPVQEKSGNAAKFICKITYQKRNPFLSYTAGLLKALKLKGSIPSKMLKVKSIFSNVSGKLVIISSTPRMQ